MSCVSMSMTTDTVRKVEMSTVQLLAKLLHMILINIAKFFVNVHAFFLARDGVKRVNNAM